MDLLKFIEIIEKKELEINITLEGKRILDIKAKNKNIDIEIFDSEGFKNLVRELRK
jgi:hypothetical protein